MNINPLYRSSKVYLMLLCFVTQSCDYYDNRLKIVNNTDISFFVGTSLYNKPDIKEFNQYEYYKDNIISPTDTFEFTKLETNGWNKYINKSYNKKLNVVLFKEKDLNNFKSIDSLLNNNFYLVKSYSEKELNQLKWVINIK